ncbi:MAG TPA: hypothetical protein VM532_16165 [Burkholderiales bacterium]|nr:hypothetical protein [Burkholderiales bacterium]
MATTTGKYFDFLNGVAALSGEVANALQNFIAARSAIRDYVISADQKHYKEVEELTELAVEIISDAKSMVDDPGSLDLLHQFIESILEWRTIAGRVRDGFANYQEIVKNKVLTNFSSLAQSGNVLLQTNASITTGVVLDVQLANVAVVTYLLNGEDRFVNDAKRAITAAKTKLDQITKDNEQMSAALQPFALALDAYSSGFREAVASRKNAYNLFNERLAPLGDEVQASIEELHDHLLETREGINDMKNLNQNRKKKNGDQIH